MSTLTAFVQHKKENFTGIHSQTLRQISVF